MALRAIIVFLLGTAFTAPSLANPFANSADSRVDYTALNQNAQKSCAALVSTSNFEFTVISSIEIAATDATPAHCRVNGVIPSEVRFEVNLPLQWNGRLYMYGNGGLAGTPAIDPGKQAQRDLALAHGFATAYTDTGHDKRVHSGGTFAYKNFQRLVDYGFRAVHLTVVSAKQLASHLYGQAPNHSYWNGCSTGGRQGMIAAQRFPEDFSGIIAGAPAADYSGLKFSQAWRVSAIINSGLNEAEALELASHIYAACDDLDGVEDGLISDPRRCDFDVQRDLPKCSGAETNACFNDTERAALTKYYAPVELQGNEVYPAMLVGSEIRGASYDGTQRSGWYPWLLNDSGPVLLDLLGSDFFRYMAFIEDRPEFDWTTFDFAQAPDNLDEFRTIVDAVNPDLSAFKANGGKLLTYFGWADPDINPLTLLAYRDQVKALDSGIDDFFRTFMLPGMFHCRGGPGPDRFDAMTALIEWVEQDRAPQMLETWHQDRRLEPRPSCAYPAEALPNRTGTLVCTTPDRVD